MVECSFVHCRQPLEYLCSCSISRTPGDFAFLSARMDKQGARKTAACVLARDAIFHLAWSHRSQNDENAHFGQEQSPPGPEERRRHSQLLPYLTAARFILATPRNATTVVTMPPYMTAVQWLLQQDSRALVTTAVEVHHLQAVPSGAPGGQEKAKNDYCRGRRRELFVGRRNSTYNVRNAAHKLVARQCTSR